MDIKLNTPELFMESLPPHGIPQRSCTKMLYNMGLIGPKPYLHTKKL
jgi:hypothetical protein